MREYYERLIGEIWEKFALFGKEQVAVGVVAALFPIVRGVHAGTIGASAVLPSLEAAIGGYLLVCVVKLGWIVIHAPVELDRRRVSEVLAKDSALKIQTEENQNLQKLAAAPKISPLEQGRRDFVSTELKDATANHIAVWKYILRQGQVEATALLHGRGIQNLADQSAPDQVISKGIQCGLLSPASGVRTYISVKPEFLEALEFYLHGWPNKPPRPHPLAQRASRFSGLNWNLLRFMRILKQTISWK